MCIDFASNPDLRRRAHNGTRVGHLQDSYDFGAVVVPLGVCGFGEEVDDSVDYYLRLLIFLLVAGHSALRISILACGRVFHQGHVILV